MSDIELDEEMDTILGEFYDALLTIAESRDYMTIRQAQSDTYYDAREALKRLLHA